MFFFKVSVHVVRSLLIKVLTTKINKTIEI